MSSSGKGKAFIKIIFIIPYAFHINAAATQRCYKYIFYKVIKTIQKAQ